VRPTRRWLVPCEGTTTGLLDRVLQTILASFSRSAVEPEQLPGGGATFETERRWSLTTVGIGPGTSPVGQPRPIGSLVMGPLSGDHSKE
jgi:hypothetical protein